MRVEHRYIKNGLYTPKGATSLLIGTFPSILIREAFNRVRPTDVDFFYGSVDNNLWRDFSFIYKKKLSYDRSDLAIKQREQLLDDLQMGMSDAVFACETEGSAMDTALQNIELNKYIIKTLDEAGTIDTLYFTSSSGKVNAETLTLRLLKEEKRLQKMQVIQKSGPRMRQFIYVNKGEERIIKTITLYSPSPLAEQWGLTREKRLEQYEKYLPEIKN
jgi:translation elongation factor EF-G